MKQRTHKHTHAVVLTLTTVSRSGAACDGGCRGEMRPGVVSGLDQCGGRSGLYFCVHVSVVLFRNVAVIPGLN